MDKLTKSTALSTTERHANTQSNSGLLSADTQRRSTTRFSPNLQKWPLLHHLEALLMISHIPHTFRILFTRLGGTCTLLLGSIPNGLIFFLLVSFLSSKRGSSQDMSSTLPPPPLSQSSPVPALLLAPISTSSRLSFFRAVIRCGPLQEARAYRHLANE